MAPADSIKYHFKGENGMIQGQTIVKDRAKVDTKHETKQLTIRIPAGLHRALKVKAAKEDVPVSTIVEVLIEGWVEGKKA